MLGSEQSKLTGEMSSSLPCCKDFINTSQFRGSKDILSKQIDFFSTVLLTCSEALPWLASVPFTLPRLSGAQCPPWPACGVLPAAEPQLCPRGTTAIHTTGHLCGRSTGHLRGQNPGMGPGRGKAAVGGGWWLGTGGSACLGPRERRGQAWWS